MTGLMGRRMAGAGLLRRGGRLIAPPTGALLDWQAGTFANASPRYIWDDTNGVLYGPFAAGVPATVELDGINYIQIEGSRTSRIEAIADWTVRGTATVTSGATDPLGGSDAYEVRGILSGSSGDTFGDASGFDNSVSIPTSFWVKRVSATGTLRLRHAGGGGDGDWNIDVSALSGSWERIHSTHAAVTVTNPFVSTAGGVGGMRFTASAGAPLDFDFYSPQQENDAAFPSSLIAPGTPTTRNADSMQFAAQPLEFLGGKWQIVVTPEFANTDVASMASHYIFYYSASNNLSFTEDGASNLNLVWRTTSGTITSANLSFSRDQDLAITLFFDGATTSSQEVAGATGGDGTVTGTTSDWISGALFVGSDSTPANHLFGRVSEPVEVP